ncbi:MAG: hypothetical protein NVSMB1_08410 [Polyangiales bacterium]
MRFVLDASVAIAAARPTEPRYAAAHARVVRVLLGADDILVPSLFVFEMGAALIRRGEASTKVKAYVRALTGREGCVVSVGPKSATRILDMAIAARLRGADACYVFLAAREEIPLFTLDREIAARAVDYCEVISP